MRPSEILRFLGFPENPIEILARLARSLSGSGTGGRAKLVAIEMVFRDEQFAAHPKAWDAFLNSRLIPSSILAEYPPVPKGWPVPVFMDQAGTGGVAHVEFEKPSVMSIGHRLDLSGPMEAFLKSCSEQGEKAFPDAYRMPFAARIRPGIRLDGRSWELPCLVGYFASHSGKSVEPLFATGVVELDGSLLPGERLQEKMEGWVREVGPGTRAVLLEAQLQSVRRFQKEFVDIKVVKDLADLVKFFREEGWLDPHLEQPDQVRCERLLKMSKAWYTQGKPRLAILTLEALGRHRPILTPRQEVLWLAELHYLHSCFGNFRQGLECLHEATKKLGETPDLLTQEERALYMAKAAVQLYDAHRFKEAEELLRPLVDKTGRPHGISGVAYAKVLGALGQVLTALDKWEEAAELLRKAISIFKAMDPLEVSRAYHYLIHNRLRAGQLEEAESLLAESKEWLEDTDLYGALFRLFYETDLSRRKNLKCARPRLPEGYVGLIHPYCFALQSWARSSCHLLEERICAIQEAAQLLIEKARPQGGVLDFLARTYESYRAHLAGDEAAYRKAWEAWQEWVTKVGGKPFQERYKGFFAAGLQEPCIEALLTGIPYH